MSHSIRREHFFIMLTRMCDEKVREALLPHIENPSSNCKLELEPASTCCWLAGLVLGQRVSFRTARKWRSYMYEKMATISTARQFSVDDLAKGEKDFIRVWGWKTWNRVWRAVSSQVWGIGEWTRDGLRLLEAAQYDWTKCDTIEPCWALLEKDKWIQRNLKYIDPFETHWKTRAELYWSKDINVILFMLWRLDLS